jgi:hypothetical protein
VFKILIRKRKTQMEKPLNSSTVITEVPFIFKEYILTSKSAIPSELKAKISMINMSRVSNLAKIL